MSNLVERLSKEQPVVVGTRLDDPHEDFRAQVERGHVFVKFTETRGETELGVRLDHALSGLDTADFDACTGEVTLVGGLVLDYVPVRFRGAFDVATLRGKGRLELADEASDD